jgi:ABC-type multidrug transport system ATPase subunit
MTSQATAGRTDDTPARTVARAMPEAQLHVEGRLGGVAISGPGPWLLGRSQTATVSFPDDRACSREQARIVRDGEGFAIENLSRSSTTSLNAKPIDGLAPVLDGATITFGVQKLTFRSTGRQNIDATIIGRVASAAVLSGQLTLDRRLTVGRQSFPGQAVFDHPAVSRRHTAFERTDKGVIVRDLGSTNGTFVNGARIDRPRPLAPGDQVDIGPFQLSFDGTNLVSKARSGNAELLVNGVDCDVRVSGERGKTIRILHGATLQILPREFVCIIGSSGSGKSTLMNILAGRVTPSAGGVTLNGSDLHKAFEALKQDIAFVPQQDVLHEQLTLRQALDYAARLRLPVDTSAEQRRVVVETAAANVDLAERLDTKIAMLSGGQKKRASLASEILNRPSLLFLDEVTSGLDESTDWEIMRLLRRLADEGMTVVVVTHTLANIGEFCHKVVCMGRGGHTTFVGSPAKALGFFGVERLGQVFNRIDAEGAKVWRSRYEDTALETTFLPPGGVAGRVSAIPQAPRESPSVLARRIVRQLTILTRRNVDLLLADRQTLTMAAVQSVVIGGLIGYAFGSFGTGPDSINAKVALLFLLGLTAIWLGCNGASKEIVGELVIYKRERDINLSTAAFVASKFIVTLVFTIIQVTIVFVLTALLAEQLPGGFLPQLGVVIMGALAGTTIGLVVSSLCNTRDQATTLVPLVLVPQIILARILVPNLPYMAEIAAKLFVSSLWITEALKSTFYTNANVLALHADPVHLDLFIILIQSSVFGATAYMVTRYRHSSRRNLR